MPLILFVQARTQEAKMAQLEYHKDNDSKCPKCGSEKIDWQGRSHAEAGQWLCNDCGYQWKGPAPYMPQSNAESDQEAGGTDGGDGE